MPVGNTLSYTSAQEKALRMSQRFMTSLRLLLAAASCLAAGRTPAQSPDLIVASVDSRSVSGDWQALRVMGTVDAVIANSGSVSTGGSCTALAFEDLDGDGRFSPGVDTALGQAVVPTLAGSASVRVPISISGPTLFRSNLIHVWIDSTQVVTESNESNNYGNSGSACSAQPPPGGIAPRIEWAWRSSSTMPSSVNVVSNPVVIDLDGDGMPEVVFPTTSGTAGSHTFPGVLRAVRGNTGAEVFTIDDPSLALSATSSLAAGDIDGDGRPEIIAGGQSDDELLAFEHDGTFKWRSALVEPVRAAAISLADLDGDGTPEIIVGRQVLDASGQQLIWTGEAGRGHHGRYPGWSVSIVADIDLDGSPEVVAGNTAYNAVGAIEWRHPSAGDGFTAIGNFDSDPEAEVVLVSRGTVRILEHDGSDKPGWPVSIPGGGDGGPPTIADYDSDGEAEIGIAGASRYVVFEADGSVRWTSQTQDRTSSITGSSVFDFDGDGSAEVVYRDELSLRIYRGTDGATLFEIPMSSCTWVEFVLVADVDADNNAEIIAVANNNCGFGPQQGVYVLGDSLDNWVSTRRIWNQHSYHITNIRDDGTIPASEPPHWLSPAGAPYNSFRQNRLANPLDAFAAPDLTASWLRVGCTTTMRIGNGGAVRVGPGVPVSFYEGDPTSSGTYLGSVLTSRPLAPGEYEDVSLSLPPGTRLARPIHAFADEGPGRLGTQRECNEANNGHAQPASAVRIGGGQGNTATATLEVGCVATSTDPGPFAVNVLSGSELRLSWSGPPLSPLIAVAGTLSPATALLPCLGSLDMAPPFAVLFDGTQVPFGLLSLDGRGRAEQRFSLPVLAPGPLLDLQGIVVSSSCPGFTAAWSISVR